MPETGSSWRHSGSGAALAACVARCCRGGKRTLCFPRGLRRSAHASKRSTGAFRREADGMWGLSSAGRAPDLHSGGHRFDPGRLHHVLRRALPVKSLQWSDFSKTCQAAMLRGRQPWIASGYRRATHAAFAARHFGSCPSTGRPRFDLRSKTPCGSVAQVVRAHA